MSGQSGSGWTTQLQHPVWARHTDLRSAAAVGKVTGGGSPLSHPSAGVCGGLRHSMTHQARHRGRLMARLS